MNKTIKKETITYDEFQEILKECKENANKYDREDEVRIKNKDFAVIAEEVCDWVYAESLNYLIFEDCILDGVDFSCCDLSNAKFINCSMVECTLETSELAYTEFKGCDLRYSTFDENNLIRTSIIDSKIDNYEFLNNTIVGINFSGTTGLVKPIDFLEEKFEKTEEGYIAYKIFNLNYIKPKKWEIKEGSILTENVNMDRFENCGCGINVATYDFVKKYPYYTIWKVLIKFEWLSETCVPYSSNGKIRCGKIKLLEKVQEGKMTNLEQSENKKIEMLLGN